ncbi:hypothetical protein [Streptomyces heilongjiangensis]|uniref:Acyl-CoA dehydrogenase C-terminal domain-containing protein n=1 Tax=Streptomyces heilongjiangensis TaxID=945052 RepID=A0ABW1BGZ8_9ACTN|nr:hypothetical protein [Streptomyces heilongjiangensis]MDC2950194.1 hypothetical protein [Streptomyces heilongjiangensis]
MSTTTRNDLEFAGLPPSLRAEIGALGEYDDDRLPAPLVAELRRSGLTRRVLSEAYGGSEESLPEFTRTLRAVAELDGSTAWLVMVWSQGSLILPRLTPWARARILDGPDVSLVSASSAGSGSVREDAGVLRVSGRWDYLSGVGHAQWVLVHCTDDRTREVVGVVLPADDLKIDRTWQVMGLSATGSHSASVDDVPVRPEQLYPLDRFDDSAVLTRHELLPHRMTFALHMAAVCVGVARGALREVGRLVRGARDHRTVELGEQACRLVMAEAALERASAQVWDEPAGSWTEAEISGLARAVCGTAASVAQAVFVLAGSRANFTALPVQRRLRDVLAASSHANVGFQRSSALGELLTGQGGPS